MLVYHRTHYAEAIMREGFLDREGLYGTAEVSRGVWVSAEPLDEDEGATGDAVVQLDVPEALFIRYEWIEEGKGVPRGADPGVGAEPALRDDPPLVRGRA
jgi:hypothetical protein